MGIEGIINKIESEAETKISELERETEEAISKIEAEIAEREKIKLKEAEERAAAESERRYEQVISREEARLRMEFLKTKQDLVSEAFERGFKAIKELPPDELRKRYTDMLASYGEKEGELIVGKSNADILDDDFMALLAREIPGSKFTRKVSDDFDYGFMLIAGKIQYDARLSEIFAAMTERITDEVAAELFKKPPEGRK
ncbi:hypothetical protein DRQ36_06430 [bacterium]|nr:MAG: hypothetical protein DRQ36_06430 [bacterium]